MHTEQITSLTDPRIHEYLRVADPAAVERAGLFVAEGRFVVQRLLALRRFRVRSLLLTPTAHAALFGTDDDVRRTDVAMPVYLAAQPLMNEIVGFNIHRGCLALAERPPTTLLSDLSLDELARIVVLEGVNNPDNVGGLFRSAAAFGADAVVLGPGCGDPLYRKAIRTSMAASLQVPFVSAGAWPDALAVFRDQGFHVIALSPASDAALIEDVPRAARMALLVGNEGAGLTRGALSAASEHARIEMTTAVDSLNVTVAASIAMHRLFAFDPRAQRPDLRSTVP
jgi:tRNA G18 (ribose-2'-O)-methylase SpoU